MLPVITLEAALGVAGGALLGALVMLVLWLRARRTVGHVLDDLRSLGQLARRERTDLERQVEGLQRWTQEMTLRLAETEEALRTLTADHRQLQEAHTGLRAAYLDAMGGGAPPSVQLSQAAAPLAEVTRAMAVQTGSLASQVAGSREAVVRCRALMDDLMHDMHRSIDLGRRLSPAGDQAGGFFQALEEGLVAVDSALRDAREQVDALVAVTEGLTQRGGAMAEAAQTHAVAVRSLATQWQRLEVATAPPATGPSA